MAISTLRHKIQTVMLMIAAKKTVSQMLFATNLLISL